ncbi:kinesin-like protein, partial [Kipferlia bialata]|eukprot:g6588.t1
MRGHSASPAPGRGSNFKVVVRVRPPIPRELDGGQYVNVTKVNDDSKVITISENLTGDRGDEPAIYSKHMFTFDHVYNQDSDQRTIYENTAREAVLSTLEGYNATVMAYGQTGSGKTYTMEGYQGEERRGIIPRSVEEIFANIQSGASENKKYLVRASYLQIYNKQITDLLDPARGHLQIREDKKRGVFVEDLSEWVVRSPSEVYHLIGKGSAERATGETRMNYMSSRSHAIFIIICEQCETVPLPPDAQADPSKEPQQNVKIGKLNLVDLAGSERVRDTGATGSRLQESTNINSSLCILGNVIAALTDSKPRTYIPY